MCLFLQKPGHDHCVVKLLKVVNKYERATSNAAKDRHK